MDAVQVFAETGVTSYAKMGLCKRKVGKGREEEACEPGRIDSCPEVRSRSCQFLFDESFTTVCHSD